MTNYFSPPKYARENAKKAKACIDKGNSAMTPKGIQRMNDLIKGKPLTLKDLKEINSFRRHKGNATHKGDYCKDKGSIAWLGWGNSIKKKKGVADFSNWAKRKYEK